jgi:hypothetical protein
MSNTRRHQRLAPVVLGTAMMIGAVLAIGTSTASANPGNSTFTHVRGIPNASQVNSSATFTQASGSPNPTSVGGPFTVTALECDRVADVQATGTMVFTDVTTGAPLGSVSLGSSPYVNCGQAQVTDSESLAAGTYRIKAAYTPSGVNPVPRSSGTYSEKVEAVAFSNISWTTGAAIPNPHFEGTVAVVGTNIYAIGGSTADCSDGDGCDPQTAVDVYHPASNRWTSAAPLANDQQDMPVSAVVDRDIYVVGGAAGQNLVDVYNPRSNSWSTLPAASDVPSSINQAWSCGAGVGSNIYVFTEGGIGILNTSASPPAWTVLPAPALLTPDGGASLFCSATRVGPNNPTSKETQIVITGPGDGSADSLSERVLVFSPASNSLAQAGATTAPMAEHSSVTIDNEAVVAGGDFSPQTVQILPAGFGSAITASNLPQPRDDSEGGAVVGGKWYIVGGGEDGENVPGGAEVLIGTPN